MSMKSSSVACAGILSFSMTCSAVSTDSSDDQFSAVRKELQDRFELIKAATEKETVEKIDPLKSNVKTSLGKMVDAVNKLWSHVETISTVA